jgi:hypothetical protein
VRVRAPKAAVPTFLPFTVGPRFAECDDPNAAYAEKRDYVREHAHILQKVIRFAPGTPGATRARQLLNQAVK